MSDAPNTRPSRATRAEEADDAQVRAGADAIEGPEAPVDETPDENVAEHYEDMMDRGAQQRGEGRIP